MGTMTAANDDVCPTCGRDDAPLHFCHDKNRRCANCLEAHEAATLCGLCLRPGAVAVGRRFGQPACETCHAAPATTLFAEPVAVFTDESELATEDPELVALLEASLDRVDFQRRQRERVTVRVVASLRFA